MAENAAYWTVRADLRRVGSNRVLAQFEIRWADSYATGWHYSWPGLCLRQAMESAKKAAGIRVKRIGRKQ